jgi:ABC-type sugar transport system permease subunit
MFGNTRPSSTVTLPINIYYTAFQGFDFGIASATAVFNVVILAVPAVIYLWVVRFRPARARAQMGEAA